MAAHAKSWDFIKSSNVIFLGVFLTGFLEGFLVFFTGVFVGISFSLINNIAKIMIFNNTEFILMGIFLNIIYWSYNLIKKKD
jgi:hypothetical protein